MYRITKTITHQHLKFALLFLAAFMVVSPRIFGQGTATFSVVYAFNGSTDGASPTIGKLVQDSAGNLYGTAQLGGIASCDPLEYAPGCGVVYRVDPDGNETPLYSFTQYTDAISGLFRGSDGSFYGTTRAGGPFNGGGTVFRVDPAGNETTLQNFGALGTSAANPLGGVFHDSKGNTYGITEDGGQGGEGCQVGGCGVLFSIDATGKTAVLHSFNGTDGTFPSGPLIADKQRNLYGIMQNGGNLPDSCFSCGTVFKYDASGTLTVLHNFSGGADGEFPYGSGLIEDGAGNLYGVTRYGGSSRDGGVVFEIDAAGNERVLYAFKGSVDGGNPSGTLLRDNAGNLYGTTTVGGESGAGVVFRIDPSGRESVLHSFTGGAGGAYPEAGLIGRKTGSQTFELYGTTYQGGNLSACLGEGCGLVFRLTLSGSTDFAPE